jgi:hypothetical protein
MEAGSFVEAYGTNVLNGYAAPGKVSHYNKS